MPAATTSTIPKIVVLMVLPPGAGSAEGRVERQASKSGRLDIRNLRAGMSTRLTRWPRFYILLIAVVTITEGEDSPHPMAFNSIRNFDVTSGEDVRSANAIFKSAVLA
jgi:hypothetical protein